MQAQDDGPPAKRRKLTPDDKPHCSHSPPSVLSDFAILHREQINVKLQRPPSSSSRTDLFTSPVKVERLLQLPLPDSVTEIPSRPGHDWELDISIWHADAEAELQCLTLHAHLDASQERLLKIVRDSYTTLNQDGSADPNEKDVVKAEGFLRPPESLDQDWALECVVYWRKNIYAFQVGDDFRVGGAKFWVHSEAKKLFPGSHTTQSTSWSPHQFYDNVHTTDNTAAVYLSQPQGLQTRLYAFQNRTIAWLLEREQVRLDGAKSTLSQVQPPVFPSFSPQVLYGGNYHVSSFLTEIHDQPPLLQLRGGMLNDEMGLGKTVELIALILLHRRDNTPIATSDSDLVASDGRKLAPSKATLVITPSSLSEQWEFELEKHAPSLKVFHYRGMKDKSNKAITEEELKEALLDFDVILTTYDVLSKEIHYAKPPTSRSLRHEKVYKVRRSALVDISWWRVCLDEAQLVESGVSNAAQVAQLIPRCNAWAVTGTPLRKDIKDLLGLLIFLRLEPFCERKTWNRLVGDGSRRGPVGNHEVFKQIFSTIAIRHTKSKIRDDINLPPQKRLTITMPFTPTEEQNYAMLLTQACDDIGVDQKGNPSAAHFDPTSASTVSKMRHWLHRLREICLYAGIGRTTRKAGINGVGQLRTVGEVLNGLLLQNETTMRAQERTVLSHKIMQGHLYSFGSDPDSALRTYQQALEQSAVAVNECRQALDKEEAKLAAMTGLSDEEAKNIVGDDDVSEGEQNEETDKKSQLAIYKQRLRSALEMQHVAYFFVATAYFQIKDAMSKSEPPASIETIDGVEKEEVACYDAAKAIRRELLGPVSKSASALVRKVAKASNKSPEPWIPFAYKPYGFESGKMVLAMQSLSDSMRRYAKHLNGWRARLVELLTKNLLDQEDETELTGEEYEISTKDQDEQYVLLEAMKAGIADWNCLLTGVANPLINHEFEAAFDMAQEDQGPSPPLYLEICQARMRLLPRENITPPTDIRAPIQTPLSFRKLLGEIGMISGREDKAKIQSALTASLAGKVRDLQKMTEEVNLFRAAMNQRLEFYKQLQQVSDSVAPLQEEASDAVDAARMQAEVAKEEKAEAKLAKSRTKQRFLLHLQNQSGEPEDCSICRDPYEVGFLTVCGHQYCKECLGIWYRQHRSCPLCKRHLKTDDFHQITHKPIELRAKTDNDDVAPNEVADNSTSQVLPRASIYSNVDASMLADINRIRLPGDSYGVKVDTISRHVLWLREHDPGSKSIIFSQSRAFLAVVAAAFRSHKIGYSDSVGADGLKKFREDPFTQCFLLSARTDSSGLNLTHATHVFLAEPLINTAIELQAIARVHRIGQLHITHVYLYLIADTVEEAIYEVSLARRLEHIRQAAQSSSSAQPSRGATPDASNVDERLLDNANSLELQAGPMAQLMSKGDAGEVVEKDDLWNCLFSKRRATQGELLTSAVAEGQGEQLGVLLREQAADARAGELTEAA